MNYKALLDPFERYAEKTLLAAGFAAMLAGSLLAYLFNGRYDGVLDLHFSRQVEWIEPLADNVINTVCLLVPLFITGRIINGRTRVVDVLTAILIARIPYYILPVFNVNNYIGNMTDRLMHQFGESGVVSGLTGSGLNVSFWEISLILVFALVSVVAMIWMVIILFRGFKTATNLKKNGHKVLFALAIIVAEMLSKIIILKMSI